MPNYNLEQIPQYLKDNALFVFADESKAPYNPHKPTEYARPGDKSTFADFQTIETQIKNGCNFINIGIGVFNGISAIDIDDCVETDGNLTPIASEIVRKMNTYTETSPSGKGLRLIFTVSKDFKYDPDKRLYKIKNDKLIGCKCLEVYVSGHTEKYVTITGHTLKGYQTIENREQELMKVLELYMKQPKPETTTTPKQTTTANGNPITDDAELIKKASENEKFYKLWSGNTEDYENDDSRADAALCSILAFWTQKDAERIDRLFRQSGLYRDKWDKRNAGGTYGSRTIQKAIESCNSVYSGRVGEDEERMDKIETFEEYRNKHNLRQHLGEIFKEIQNTEPPISTGYRHLDYVLEGGLKPGLYGVGGLTSVGKTTYVLQMAAQIAKQQRDVLIFSLEMSEKELTCKNLSRETIQVVLETDGDPKNAKTQNGVEKANFYNDEEKKVFEQAVNRLSDYGDHIYIIEGDIQTTTETIKKDIQRHITLTNNKPIVFVDYLQILSLSVKGTTDTKVMTDNVIWNLKLISRDLDIPIVCVSSFNRANYSIEANFSSFKESGLIEYSCDCLIALQFKGTGKSGFDERAAKQSNPREIEVCILKNRRGGQGDKIEYQYYSKFNYFEEIEIH